MYSHSELTASTYSVLEVLSKVVMPVPLYSVLVVHNCSIELLEYIYIKLGTYVELFGDGSGRQIKHCQDVSVNSEQLASRSTGYRGQVLAHDGGRKFFLNKATLLVDDTLTRLENHRRDNVTYYRDFVGDDINGV